MRSVIAGVIAIAAVAATSPASAQWHNHRHGGWHGGPGISFSFGAPYSYGYYDGPYAAGPAYYGYGYENCRIVRERIVRPNGRVVRRNVRRCY